MNKTLLILTAATAMAIAMIPAKADVAPNGMRMNGIVLQGMRMNGPVLNGPVLQGAKFNGPVLQGTKTGGVSDGGISVIAIELADGRVLQAE
jgi:hypothetical protein